MARPHRLVAHSRRNPRSSSAGPAYGASFTATYEAACSSAVRLEPENISGNGGISQRFAPQHVNSAPKHRDAKTVQKDRDQQQHSLGQILWEQMVLGYPEYGVRQPEPFVDYAALATANGALGIKVERARDVHKAVQRALSHHGPALVDVNVNPDEPPLPGKVEYDQAKKFAQAFLKASRARPRSRPRCSVTRSTSSGRDRLRAALAERAATAGGLRRHTGRLIEAVDPGPGPGPDVPRVPLDTLLDDADSSGMAAGPDRTAEVGPGAPQHASR